MDEVRHEAQLFNGDVETGIRALVVLDALHPRTCDISELTWFDYLLLHSSDFEGPPSLHPDLPSRSGELLVRKRAVERGIRLLQRLHLVDVEGTDRGFCLTTGEDARSFIALLGSEYSLRLCERADWIARTFGSLTHDEVRSLINRAFDQRRVEAFGMDPKGGSHD